MPNRKSPVETALKMLSKRRLSSYELKKKMKAKGFSEKEINDAINYLQSSHYLNDSELLADYVNLLIEKKMYGPEKVIAYLKQKGFESAAIEELISSSFSDEIFLNNARKIIAKKVKDIDTEDPKKKNKIIRLLTYNGYSWDIIERIINQ
jgi:regulatory protein